MSSDKPGTNIFFYVIVLIAAAAIALFVFLRNFHAGEEAASVAPPPAEQSNGAAKAIDERALAKDQSLASKGKALFETNCSSCHGPQGNGDGPRGASLNPRPRNYHTEKFKFGNDIVSIHNTLMKGSPGTSMPSFALLPLEDTWAIAHFVYTLIPNPPPITDQVLAPLAGSAASGGTNSQSAKADSGTTQTTQPGKTAATTAPANVAPAEEKRIPIQVAMQQMTVSKNPESQPLAYLSTAPGAALYAAHCASCHGEYGEGKRLRVISVAPYRYETSADLTISKAPWVNDRNKFSQIVVQGMPGRMMPGQATLTSAQIDDLYGFVHSLVKTR